MQESVTRSSIGDDCVALFCVTVKFLHLRALFDILYKKQKISELFVRNTKKSGNDVWQMW